MDLANGTRIRKGAFDAIRKMSEAAGNKYPKEVADLVQKITSYGGTPLVVSQDDFIIGVIELQDMSNGSRTFLNVCGWSVRR